MFYGLMVFFHLYHKLFDIQKYYKYWTQLNQNYSDVTIILKFTVAKYS